MKADGQRLQSLPLPGGATEQLCHHCPLQTRMVRALDSPSPHCWMRLPQEGSSPGDPRSLWKTRDLGTADSWRPSSDHTPWSWAAGSSLMGVGESVVNDFLLNVIAADAINACSTFLQPTLEFICSCGGFFLCRLIASPFCCSGQLTLSYRQHTYTHIHTPHHMKENCCVFRCQILRNLGARICHRALNSRNGLALLKETDSFERRICTCVSHEQNSITL